MVEKKRRKIEKPEVSLENDVRLKLSHHIRQELCTTRAPYRQGRKLTAVKVYTVNDESQHLLIFNVPAIDLVEEVKALCTRFGDLHGFYRLHTDSDEDFTHTYHAHFAQIRQARFAKRHIDDKSFYGGVLHVCYAPEMESVEETRSKLINRRREIIFHSGKSINSTPFLKTKFIPNKTPKTKPPSQKLPKQMNPNIAGLQQNLAALQPLPSTSSQVPTFEYPSQKVWVQPGSQPSIQKAKTNFVPSSILKQNIQQKPPNKIIFHKKT